MTYPTLTQPAATHGPRDILHAIGAFLGRVGTAMMNGSAGARRLDQIRALQEKSDADLAKMGLKRDQIVHHVFRDTYYL